MTIAEINRIDDLYGLCKIYTKLMNDLSDCDNYKRLPHLNDLIYFTQLKMRKMLNDEYLRELTEL